MRKAIVIGCLVLCSCASKEALIEEQSAKSDLAQLRAQLQAEIAATGKENDQIKRMILDAEARLISARETVRVEKVQSVTGPVAAVAETAAPWADKLMPGIGVALMAVAGIANRIGGNVKKEVA